MLSANSVLWMYVFVFINLLRLSHRPVNTTIKYQEDIDDEIEGGTYDEEM